MGDSMSVSAASANTIVLDGKEGLTPEDFGRVVFDGWRVELADDLLDALSRVREKVDALVRKSKPIYGVNTGVGSKKNEAMQSPEEIAEFHRVFIASHCVGVGEPLPESVARGLVYLRLLSFTHNLSGVRPELCQRLAAMLNHGIIPVIPSQGSVGASGDLAPLSHLAACVIGVLHHRTESGDLVPLETQPQVIFGGEQMAAGRAWEQCGEASSFVPAAKEALALSNGATLILSEGLVSLIELESLFEGALDAAALSCEALRVEKQAFDERIIAARPHPGAIYVADKMRDILDETELCTRHFRREFAREVSRLYPDRPAKKLDPDVPRLQDAYSFRAIPQVLGACFDAITHARGVFSREMASATDNPLCFETKTGEDGLDVLSGANFHGEPLALAADYLKIAAAEIASIAERRIAALLDPAHNYGLPADLASTPSDTGLMILQYTAAALVSENKTLAHPGSVDSIPTSAGQEDHVSMGSISTRQLRRIVENVRCVVAIEIICAITGVRAVMKVCDECDLARPKLGRGTAVCFEKWNKIVGEIYPDTYFAAVIEKVAGELRAK